MWFTGNLFRGPLEAYNAQDKSMITVEVAADFTKIRAFQDNLLKDIEKEKEAINNRKNIRPLFKGPQEEPKPTPRIVQIPGPGTPTQRAKYNVPKVQIGGPKITKPTLTPTQKSIPPLKIKKP
jgi:hypothetical protein